MIGIPADISPESIRAAESETGVTAGELAKLLTTHQEAKFARLALEAAVVRYDDRPSDQARIQRDATLGRYIGILQDSIAGSHAGLLESLGHAKSIVGAPDARPEETDFIARSLVLIGVAVLASASAGAIGALFVKEMVWKEVVKSAIGALITGTAALAAERILRKGRPSSGGTE